MRDSVKTSFAFAEKLNSVEQAPDPLRSALVQALRSGDNLRCLVFGPMQKLIGKVLPASLVAILDNGWVVGVCGEDAQPEIHRCSFAATLLAELTEVLLYGRLRLDFVEHGRARSVEIHFNTVADWLYREALELMLRGMAGQPVGDDAGKADAAVKALPIKFRNGLRRYLPAGDSVQELVHWPAAVESRWPLFRREYVPQAVLVLTDAWLLLISEERALWRGKWSQNAKYGYVITYYPLPRVASIRLGEYGEHSILEGKLCVDQFCANFRIDFSDEQRAAVHDLIKSISVLHNPMIA